MSLSTETVRAAVAHRRPEMKPGRVVMTQFTGRTTFHTIVERRDDVQSQSRSMIRVDPPVSRDVSNPYHDDFVDVAWFRMADEQLSLAL